MESMNKAGEVEGGAAAGVPYVEVCHQGDRVVLNQVIGEQSYTACSRSLNPFHIVSYYIKWIKTTWTYSIR